MSDLPWLSYSNKGATQIHYQNEIVVALSNCSTFLYLKILFTVAD